MRTERVVRLSGEKIDGSCCSCLGTQLARVLEFLDETLGSVVWHVADVDAHQVLPDALKTRSDFRLRRVGDTAELRELAGTVEQFLSGVFLAVPAQTSSPRLPNAIGTEDEPFGEIGDAIVEIRAFDTTALEVYARATVRIESLARAFLVAIESSD